MVRIFNKIAVAFKTKENLFDGTRATLFITINTKGVDVAYEPLVPGQDYARSEFANFFEINIEEGVPIDSSSYARIEIGTYKGWYDTRDSWSPRRILVWGVSSDRCYPIAFDDSMHNELASSHLSPVSAPVPRVRMATTRESINTILIVLATGSEPQDSTADPVKFSILGNRSKKKRQSLAIVHVNESKEPDLKTGLYRIYRIAIKPFQVNSLEHGSFVVEVDGMDSWMPRRLIVFGVSAGNNHVVLHATHTWTLGQINSQQKFSFPIVNKLNPPRELRD